MRMKLTCFLFSLSWLMTACAPQGSDSNSDATGSRPAKLKLVSYVALSTNILGEQVEHITTEIERVSADNIMVKVFEPGMIVGSSEILEAVSDGKIDMGYSTAGFWMGKIPASPIFSSVPFGPDTPEFLSWLFQGNGLNLYQEMYDAYGFNVKVIPCAIIPPETSGWFSKPINSPEDLKGLNMRFYGLGGAVMAKLGVSVSVLSPGEIFPALEKGVLDATEFSLPSIDEGLGLYKLAKYNYYPGWHQQSTLFELTINKDTWNSLSPSQQAIIETVCHASLVESIAYGEGIQAATIKRNTEERGVKNMEWSPEMLDLFEEKWAEVVAEQSAKDPFFKKVFDDLTAFRSEYAIWKNKAYLK